MNDEILKNENNQANMFKEKIESEKGTLQKKFSGIEKDTQELLANIRDQGLSYTDMMDVLRSVQDTYDSIDIKYFAEKMSEFQYLKSTPFFARIDLQSKDKQLEKFYLSKFGFFEDGKPLLIDWRTKLASLYYKNRFPKEGVFFNIGDETFTFDMKLKRTFEFDEGQVTKYFNNDIGLSENEIIIDKIKGRSGGVLEDIVETIQESQIDIIDADPRQVCIVQGCVGSGKSTVAIHKLSHIFFNYSELIKPEKSILISKSRVLVDYLSTLFPRLGIFDLKYKTVRDLMFKLLTQDVPKIKFNLDINRDISDIHLDFFNKLDKNIQVIKRNTFDEISSLVNNGMNSETSYYKFDENLSAKSQILEITSDLDEAVSFLKEDVRELKGNLFEIEKKKLTINRIQNIKKEIKSIESSLLNKSFKKILKIYSVLGVLGYRESLIFLYTYTELYGIKEGDMFEYCVIDEAQDLCVLELAIISKFVTNNRFCIIGDLNQNIHNNPLATWEEIFPIFKGSKISTFQLDTNYRSTRNIIEFSNKILSSFTNLYLPKSIEKFGSEVVLVESKSSDERFNTFSELIQKDFDDLKKSVGVIFYNFEEYERYITLLQNISQNTEKLIVLSEFKKAVYSPRVVYATEFSNCKGLEFNKVYLFGFNSNKINDFEEAKKFFVGSTRAMNELIIFN